MVGIKNFKFGEYLIVQMSFCKRLDHFFFDFLLIINEVVMTQASERAPFDQVFISATANAKCVNSLNQRSILLDEVYNLVGVSNSTICEQKNVCLLVLSRFR